jgi:hypothetical protein
MLNYSIFHLNDLILTKEVSPMEKRNLLSAVIHLGEGKRSMHHMTQLITASSEYCT